MNPVDPKKDNHFSSFALGLAVGVIGALLVGTEEGRKLAKEAYDSLPEKYKKIPENIFPSKESAANVPSNPVINPLETPHHATYEFEAPPPPPPSVNLFHPK